MNKTKEGQIEKKIKLSIGILVSNHIEYIERVLSSIKPLLDGLPSELIVVDTVGPKKTDGSLNVAKRFTDKIYPFEWCNDFSKARNVCLEHASGEWFMYLDDDEIFENVEEILDFFTTGECDSFQSGIYHKLNYLPDGGKSMAAEQRLIRRRNNTCFVGRIHESFNEIYEPCKLFCAFVHHYGYMLKDEASVRKHQERNLTILRKEIAEKGLDARIAAQLVQELIFTKETEEEGYKELQNSINSLSQEELRTSSGQWLLTAGASYFYNLGKHEEALVEYRKVSEQYFLNETARLVLSGTCVYSAAHLEKPEACVKYAKEYAECYKKLEEDRTLAVRQMNLGTENYRQKEYAQGVIPLGIHACLKLGKYDESLGLIIMMRDLGLNLYQEYTEFLDVTLNNATDRSLKKSFLSTFLSDEGMSVYGYK